MTSKTEGKAFSDATGVPLLVKYDTRLRENLAKNIVQDVTSQVQVRTSLLSACSPNSDLAFYDRYTSSDGQGV